MKSIDENEIVAHVEAQAELLEDIREQTADAPATLSEFFDEIAAGAPLLLPSGAEIEAGFAAGIIQGWAMAHGMESRDLLDRVVALRR